MRYGEIARMCRPVGGVPGCPFDGLGCAHMACSVHSRGEDVRDRAWDATEYGPDFHCVKREHHIRDALVHHTEKP